jgi:hypothetical protein
VRNERAAEVKEGVAFRSLAGLVRASRFYCLIYKVKLPREFRVDFVKDRSICDLASLIHRHDRHE